MRLRLSAFGSIELEKLGWGAFMLAVPRYNKRMLKEKIPEVQRILSQFTYPYNRRIAGAHGNFSKQDYKKWLQQAKIEDLAHALRRLASSTRPRLTYFGREVKHRNLRASKQCSI